MRHPGGVERGAGAGDQVVGDVAGDDALDDAVEHRIGRRRLDHAAAEATDAGSDVTCDSLGATLLALADVDPGDFLPGASASSALLKPRSSGPKTSATGPWASISRGTAT